MRKLLFSALAMLSLTAGMAQSTITVSGEITTATTWTNNNIYLIDGFLYIEDGGELTIEEGTLIKGVVGTKATIIVTRTGVIHATGTACQPIVFTSNQPAGSRAAGDIGGVIILGNATINVPGGTAVIEGGVDTPEGDGVYGGADDSDNSGELQYFRIEFGGVAFVPGSEINGLTMGGVGSGTTIDHVQVSFGGDDSFEWFGGTVDGKYLVSFKPVDDGFDSDFGHRGKIQYGVHVADPAISDVSGSNMFECDNDATGSTNTPKTNTLFSNMTAIGPYAYGTPASNHKRGSHLRRNTEASIANSIIIGASEIALRIEGANTSLGAAAGDLIYRNNILAGNGSAGTSNYNCTSCDASFDILAWEAGNNTTEYSAISSASLTDIANYDFRPTALSPANFVGTNFTGDYSSAYFDATSYVGAFSTSNDWTECWVNWDPQNTDYSTPGINYNPIVSASVVNSSCPTTGSIDLSVSGGIGPFTYSWSNGATTQDLAGLAPGTYSVTVSGCNCSTTASYTVNDVVVGKPTGASITGTTSCSMVYNWGAVAGASSYEVRIKNVATGVFSPITNVGAATTYTFTGLLAGTSYQCQVRSKCVTTEKSGWTSKTASTTTGCSVPYGTSESGITSSASTLNWVDPCAVNNYKINYRAVGSPTWINVNAVSTSKVLTGLTAGTTYEWRVRTNCGGGSLSSWSAIDNFTTNPLRLANDVITDANAVVLYPNPANNVLNIQLEVASVISISISNLMGQEVYRQDNVDMNGVNNIQIDLSNLASGSYLVNISGSNIQISKELVINK